jgi:hypothetical protein
MILFSALISTANGGTPAYPDLSVTKDDQSGLDFVYLVPEPTKSTINYKEQVYDALEIKDCSYTFVDGLPQLPVRIVVVGVPPEGEVKITYNAITQKEVDNLNILPAEDKRSPEKPSLKQTISGTGLYPQQLVDLEGPMFIRSQRVVRLKIYPVQYNPSTKSATIHSQVSIQVSFSPAKSDFSPAVSTERFEQIFKESLLNYQTAKAWRVERSLTGSPQQADPFVYSDNWYKITVSNNGLYQIDRAFLQSAGIDPNSIDPRTIRIFNGGGKVLPVLNESPRPEFKELTVFVSGESDGSFDAGDYVLFYGWSVDNWEYDSSLSRYRFYSNPYTSENVFWLTWNGSFPDTPKRWIQKNGSLGSYDRVSTTFREKLHFEQNQRLQDFDGEIFNYFTWFWLKQSSFNLAANLKGVVSSDTSELRISASSNSPLPSFVSINGIAPISVTRDGVAAVIKTTSLVAGSNQFQANYSQSVFLDFYQILYTRFLDGSDGNLMFDNPSFDGVVRYDVPNVNFASPYVLDLSDMFNPVQITNYQLAGTTLSFQDSSSSFSKKSYLLLNSSQIRRPSGILFASKPNLRDINDPSNRADLIIISHPIFLSSIAQLADFERTFHNLDVKLINVEDIYNHFSWGLFDPVAIRDFLKYTYRNWTNPRPAYCLLVGDGSYDYKDYLSLGSVNYIPPFAEQQNVSDDNYIFFGTYTRRFYYDSDSSLGTDRGLDMVIARWPVKSGAEVLNLIQKTTEYQAQPEFGNWKNLITLVADDEYNPGLNPPRSDEDFHTNYTEGLAVNYIPSVYNLSKIYAIEYPFDVGGKKPSAEEAIVNQINAGTLLLNYSGHGNPDVWAHENIFRRTADIPRLRNGKKMPVISTFSCSIGFFDSPNSEGMAEELVRASGGGAVGVVAATRLVFALSNKILNDLFFDRLLKNDSLSVAEALYLTKLLRQPSSNDRNYMVFGDPLLSLGVPQLEAKISSLTPDTLQAGSLVSYQGEIYDRTGAFRSDYSGQAEVTAYDAAEKRIHLMPDGRAINYSMPGSRLFKGKISIQSGQFQGAFIVPKDISYGAPDARISIYVSNGSEDGRGLLDSIPVGSSLDSLADQQGPEIKIEFVNQTDPRDYDYVDPQPTLKMTITDSSGINVTGGLGHDITITLDDNQLFTVTELFQYEPGNYQSGTLTYQLPFLSAGTHKIEVKAWDNLNNSGLGDLTFQVADLSELLITDVMNYPNPFSGQTYFTYQLSQDAEEVEIGIYSLSGRPIKQITPASSQAGYNYATTWDGRDQDGDKVASGVYLYKVTAKGKVFKDGKLTNESKKVFGKLVYQR